MRVLHSFALVGAFFCVAFLQTGVAQDISAADEGAVQLLPSGEMIQWDQARGLIEPVRGAFTDSLYYDDGNSGPDSYIGFGSSVNTFYASTRFTATSAFTLTGFRVAYRTQFSSTLLYVWITDASAGNNSPSGGNLLFEGSISAPSQNGRFGLFTFSEPVATFPAGQSFFITVGFQNVPHPMGADNTGQSNSSGRHFFSGNGNTWTVLGDILENGVDDAWVLRALGTGSGGGSPNIAVSPGSLSITLPAGNTQTRTLTISNSGNATLNWSASANSSRGDDDDFPIMQFLPGDGADLQDLQIIARRRGAVPVIVELNVPFVPEGFLGEDEIMGQRQAIYAGQDAVLASLPDRGELNVTRFTISPYLALVADEEVLERLAADSNVAAIHEDRFDTPSLNVSIPIIGAQNVWNQGLRGQGQTVAVLDSGVQAAHPFFQGRVVAEACFSRAVAGQTQSLCPNGQQQQTGPGSGNACQLEDCEHGTHVAGIVAGSQSQFSGVARQANLIGVQVFTAVTLTEVCGNQIPCIRTLTSDQILALEHVYSLRNQFSIASINMSLGGGQFTAPCDSDERTPIANTLRSAGIAIVAASGNESFTNAMGAPACISSVVSVGSTQTGVGPTTLDAVSSFSNSASFLDLLAPGEFINSSVLNAQYNYLAGTSMASPHVAGAWAIMRQQNPSVSIDVVLSRFKSTGVSITDPRNGITKPRLQLDAAVNAGGSTNWLSVSPGSGSTAAGGSSSLTVTVNAAGMSNGTYNGSIVITSNASNSSTVTIPVTIVLQGSSNEEYNDVSGIALDQNYPNPVSGITTISYGVSVPTAVRLELHDTLGREVTVLVDQVMASGWHEAILDTSFLAPGMYFYRLTAGDQVVVRRMMVVR